MKTWITFCCLFAVAHAAPPNFIFMLSDDQDWTGLSVQMHPDVPSAKSDVIDTPHIARLAREGMRFSAAYAPASVCSPTRISLQTGKSPAQLHWTKAGPSVTAAANYKMIAPRLKRALDEKETTIAELLKPLGYATAHYGKWHLAGGGPERHGYDESDGDTSNGDAAPHKDPNPVDIVGMGRRATAFMQKQQQAGKPFFIQLSYHALHYPENASKDLLEKYRAKLPRSNPKEYQRAAISEDLDRGVGMILAAVEKLGLRENTYLIYMSDNGGGGRRNRPVRGGKGSVWEGGIRVPLIIRGPGIAANSWSHQRVVGYDLLPTLYRMAGGRASLPEGVEGGDFQHLLRGQNRPIRRPHPGLVFHFPHYQGADGPHTAIILDDYKLLHFYETGEDKVFQLSKDLGEAEDLSRRLPEKTAALRNSLDAYLKAIKAQLPAVNASYDPSRPSAERKKGGKGKEKKPPRKERKGA